MGDRKKSRLRFNFGFLLEADYGTSRDIELDYPSVQAGEDVVLTPLQGKFRVTRTSKGLYLQGVLDTTIVTECTRCLAEVLLPIQVELDDLYYYPPSDVPEGEYSVGEDGIIDLAPLLRELSLLEVPMQVFCQSGCKGICPECGQDWNEGRCDCHENKVDPRLEALRSLLDNNS